MYVKFHIYVVFVLINSVLLQMYFSGCKKIITISLKIIINKTENIHEKKFMVNTCFTKCSASL